LTDHIMTARSAPSAFALPIAIAALIFASAADAQVYKCKQANGTVAYQDSPCQGGAVVDIRAGSDDPAAVDRLDRANAEFNRAAAARSANEAIAAQSRAAAYQRQQAAEAAQAMAEAAANPSVIYVPYGVPDPRRKHRPDVRHQTEPRRAVSAHAGTSAAARKHPD
jgi:uncharacterized protein YyaL (SSP411 family)